jgi:hypothetical protein
MLFEQLRLLESDKVVTVVHGRELEKVDMSIADMHNYREKVIVDLEGVTRDLDLLGADEAALNAQIAAYQQQIDHILVDR